MSKTVVLKNKSPFDLDMDLLEYMEELPNTKVIGDVRYETMKDNEGYYKVHVEVVESE